MGRTQTHSDGEIAIKTLNRTITVRRTSPKRFSVTVKTAAWKITKKNLSTSNVQWFTLLAAKARQKTLRRTIPRLKKKRIRVHLKLDSFKTNGVNWIALRMAQGARPIILKAPALFRGAMLYIEATEQENVYTMRVIDSNSDARTEALQVDRATVVSAIESFGDTDNSHDSEQLSPVRN